MTTVFIGGSRAIVQLPEAAVARLRNITARQHAVVIGDAAGADLAVQRFFEAEHYPSVTVYCAGHRPRHNVGGWELRQVAARGAKGFQFFAEKDRAMAQEADIGLMIWDGKSPGTLLNLLRLLRSGKYAVLMDLPAGHTLNFKTILDWERFLETLSPEARLGLKKRATPAEWALERAVQDELPSSLKGAA